MFGVNIDLDLGDFVLVGSFLTALLGAAMAWVALYLAIDNVALIGAMLGGSAGILLGMVAGYKLFERGWETAKAFTVPLLLGAACFSGGVTINLLLI